MENKVIELNDGKVHKYFYCNRDFNLVFNLKNNSTLELKELFFEDQTCNLTVNLEDENTSFNASNLVVGNNKKINLNQTINHNKKATNSDIKNYCFSAFSSVNFKTSSTIFEGNKKSNAKQLTKGIILNDKSLISSEPILNIYENDVLASHGCAIGKIREEELFYLMSRGLTKNEAVILITKGIIEPFFTDLDQKTLKLTVYDLIHGAENE